MTKAEFRELINKKGIVYLDGATGSNLQMRGLPQGVCPEYWMCEHQDIIEGLQDEFTAAGTDILYAPTFTANRIKLDEYGLVDKLDYINTTLINMSKRVAERATHKVYVAADLSMTGIQLKPMGPMDFEELVDIYKEQLKVVADAGADLVVIETMMSLQETRAAVIAAKETCPDLPVMTTLTFNEDGRTLYGTDPITAAVVLSKLGVDALGANCSTGPKDMACVVRKMAEVCDIPIIAKPNAGIPTLDANGKTVYNNTAENFADEMKELIDAGATILGGCCGTEPSYIAETVKKGYKPGVRPKDNRPNVHYLTSERMTFSFTLDDAFFVVGERINPTGKKTLQAELREGNTDRVAVFAEEQEENGAKILDVNMGMGGIDEKSMMLRVLEELQSITNLPISIDSSHVDIIEAALRRYPGRALINSISYEQEKFEKLLPIAKKYGAAFILLPLSDKGLPENLQEKIDIIDKISSAALDMGFTKEDIIVDGLVATVGANKNGGVETLETIRYCKNNGYATTCGLSNISFGLPERGYINAAFLSMAICEGLTMAIANPNQNLLMSTALACNLLNNKENADLVYIEKMNDLISAGVSLSNASQNAAAAVEQKEKPSDIVLLAEDGSKLPSSAVELYSMVLKGKKNSVTAQTKVCIDEGINPQVLLNDVLIVAINAVGDLFEKGKYFLPQLINSAEAMKISIEYLEPLLQSGDDSAEKHTVVIATVSGDIHDIGKNLVALMLKNYGFNVIDLGKDVDREVIIDTAIREKADIIALSALMTTTMKEMEEVIKLAKERGCTAKISIGGAVTTQEYADEIGADGYSKDAAECVKLCKRLLGMIQI
ncbi:MAG: homocysteine S-methyltransferase family protein [Lachnospiraceae bacterium]|nr:homocysteine S-methyltransferase family protein [Candidatus Colinaster scatohippi]